MVMEAKSAIGAVHGERSTWPRSLVGDSRDLFEQTANDINRIRIIKKIARELSRLRSRLRVRVDS
jgi:hypothetical protein